MLTPPNGASKASAALLEPFLQESVDSPKAPELDGHKTKAGYLEVPRERHDAEPLEAPGSTRSSVPPSFKATRPRKTSKVIQDFQAIEMASAASSRRTRSEAPQDVDPRLLDDDSQLILAKVASALHDHYVKSEKRDVPRGPDEDPFHEENFIRKRCLASCFAWRRSTPSPSVESILKLISDLCQSLYFCKQIVVLGLIYIERFLDRTSMGLTAGNWRSLVIVAILMASKVGEDIHPWNADFEECLADIACLRFQPGALFNLESLFLDRLKWCVFVNGETYAAYFFALLEDGEIPVAKTRRGSSGLKRRFTLPDILDTVSEHASSESEQSSMSDFEDMAMQMGHKSTASERLEPGLSARTIHEVWRLDAHHPLIGTLRHAPRALAPSPHIHQTTERLWEHKLAAKTSEQMTQPGRIREAAGATLSGATGAQLASELRRYLDKKSPPSLLERLDEPEQAQPKDAGGFSSWADDGFFGKG